MKFSRRSFLAGLAAATAATVVPKGRAQAALADDSYATLIDLTRCDGCPGKDTPACVSACRRHNASRFPEPDPAMLKDYWPQKSHEDWSGRRELTERLTPYNWLFVQKVTVEVDGQPQELTIPRRCMHCDNPPCVKLCPFGTAKKDKDGPVHIDPSLCFGGAKCRTVCPWDVPQRQAGVGVYTYLDPAPVGGGVMYKCDLCRDDLARGEKPACMTACPQGAMHIGHRQDILRQAEALAVSYSGHLYGKTEHGGTATLYVSKVPFDQIDAALRQGADSAKVMRLHNPENALEKQSTLAKAALLAPVAGVVGAFAATVSKREKNDEK